jgi:hypothetical protein
LTPQSSVATAIQETARLIVAEKNADELFQNFVWHTSDVDWDKAKKDPNEVLPVDKAKYGTLLYQHMHINQSPNVVTHHIF